jgi:hypothetical protein
VKGGTIAGSSVEKSELRDVVASVARRRARGHAGPSSDWELTQGSPHLHRTCSQVPRDSPALSQFIASIREGSNHLPSVLGGDGILENPALEGPILE